MYWVIYKYGDIDNDDMEVREKAFSGAMTMLFKSLFKLLSFCEGYRSLRFQVGNFPRFFDALI